MAQSTNASEVTECLGLSNGSVDERQDTFY